MLSLRPSSGPHQPHRLRARREARGDLGVGPVGQIFGDEAERAQGTKRSAGLIPAPCAIAFHGTTNASSMNRTVVLNRGAERKLIYSPDLLLRWIDTAVCSDAALLRRVAARCAAH